VRRDAFFSSAVKGLSLRSCEGKAIAGGRRGYANGNDFPVISCSTIASYSDLAGFIAKRNWKRWASGYRWKCTEKPVLEQTAKSELLFRGSWIARLSRCGELSQCVYSKNPAPPNYTRYKNPLFDQLYERSLTEENDSVKYALYRRMDQLMIDDAPVGAVMV